MTSWTRLGGIGRALQHRDYRLYWMGASGSFLGTWVYRTGLGWFTWELTHSTAWLGIVVFVEVLPNLLLVPIMGAVCDRVGPLRMAKLSQILAVLVMSLLATFTALGLMTIHLLIAIVVTNGVIMSMNQPSFFALTASLVPREDLSPAIGIQSAMVQTARFLGPALAGALIVRFGAEATFAVNAASYLCVLAALFSIAYRDPPIKATGAKGLFDDVVEGLTFVAGHFAIRTVLMLTVILALLLRPVMELMPGFASEVFGRGADGLAWLMSAAGLGAIFGSLWIANRGRTKGLTRILTGTTLATALLLLGFAFTEDFRVGVTLIAVYGLAANVNSISSQILVQSAVQPAMRGRVMSLVGLTFRGVPALGAAIVGWIASHVGLHVPIAASALIALLAAVWMVRLIRRAGLAEHAEAPPP